MVEETLTLDGRVSKTSAASHPKWFATKRADSDTAAVSGAATNSVGAQGDLLPSTSLIVRTDEQRLFFPCNREDALLLLGGLCISQWFPVPGVRLAVDDAGVALISEGLRAQEEVLICGEVSSRFPLLVECALRSSKSGPTLIETGKVLRLVFRTKDDADAFRYRPVDEFDPSSIDWAVEPQRFNLPGDARFILRAPSDASALNLGHLADRLVAGVASMVALGDACEACRESIDKFINAGNQEVIGLSPSLTDFVARLSKFQQDGGVEIVDVILKAFSSSDDGAPREVIDAIAHGFETMNAAEHPAGGVEGRWLQIARGVAKSKVELNGDLLSDDKSVLLRAALLAAFAADSNAVLAFLDAEKPVGLKVATVASFLVGLKRGIVGESWTRKMPRAPMLGAAIGELLHGFHDATKDLSAQIQAVREDGNSSTTILTVSIGTVKVAEWSAKRHIQPDPIEVDWLAALDGSNYTVIDTGGAMHSWRVRPPGSERILELRHAEIGSPPQRFPVFRFNFPEELKLNKVKEIAAAFEGGGRLWIPRRDPAQRLFLSCELPSLPCGPDLQLMMGALESAVALCAAPVKTRKPRKKALGPRAVA